MSPFYFFKELVTNSGIDSFWTICINRCRLENKSIFYSLHSESLPSPASSATAPLRAAMAAASEAARPPWSAALISGKAPFFMASVSIFFSWVPR